MFADFFSNVNEILDGQADAPWQHDRITDEDVLRMAEWYEGKRMVESDSLDHGWL